MLAKKVKRRIRIKRSIRRKISGTASIPRLSVFRSNKQIYAQLVDDVNGHTLAAASTSEKGMENARGTKTDIAKMIGIALAKKATAAKIKDVVFDRNGYLYHGRVKAVAEGAREGGLNF